MEVQKEEPGPWNAFQLPLLYALARERAAVILVQLIPMGEPSSRRELQEPEVEGLAESPEDADIDRPAERPNKRRTTIRVYAELAMKTYIIWAS